MYRRIVALRPSLTLIMLLLIGGCSRAVVPPQPPSPPPSPPEVIRASFDRTLQSMAARDRASTWDESVCRDMAAEFLALAAQQRGADQAVCSYNAALCLQRCGLADEARPHLLAALKASPALHRAKVQLALIDVQERGDAALDDAIARVHSAVVDAKFQDADALVNLALLQMKRNGDRGQAGCEDDMACAKLNVQRALAIDDGYMPAFNQLALLYLAKARSKAGLDIASARHLMTAHTSRPELSPQMLDLAALVCSQAIRRNPRYAPIHNTLGLILVELGNTNRAVQEFNEARRLDPRFFEAHVNYAAVNLSFRGYDQAEAAYRAALAIRPDDYEARLGLALALRGQLDATNIDNRMAEVREHIGKAVSVDGARPEAYFNEAILIQEYEAKFAATDQEKVARYRAAKAVFGTFLEKARNDPAYQDAIRNAEERVIDINEMIRFYE